LVNKEDEQYREKSAKQEKKLDTGIEIQAFVIKLSRRKWLKLLEY
jgi:hypothetical protein